MNKRFDVDVVIMFLYCRNNEVIVKVVGLNRLGMSGFRSNLKSIIMNENA